MSFTKQHSNSYIAPNNDGIFQLDYSSMMHTRIAWGGIFASVSYFVDNV